MDTRNSISTANSLPILSSPQPLSAKLSALINSGESPIVGPNTATELRNWLAIPEPQLEMPTEDRIDTMIARLSLATKERRSSYGEAKERLIIYWRALRDIPLVDLAAAFDELIKSQTFMPTPAEIRKAAFAFTAKRNFTRSRAKHLVIS